jgi:hypothetical protein
VLVKQRHTAGALYLANLSAPHIGEHIDRPIVPHAQGLDNPSIKLASSPCVTATQKVRSSMSFRASSSSRSIAIRCSSKNARATVAELPGSTERPLSTHCGH